MASGFRAQVGGAAGSGGGTFRMREAEWQRFRQAVAVGLLSVALAVEHDAKAEAPVAGGHRSFHEGEPPVGGTLRRSIHAAAYLDGERVTGSRATDENGDPVPDHATTHAIQAFVGTNLEYAGYVEMGTVRMPARPYLGPALAGVIAEAPGIMAGAVRRVTGR